MSGAIENFTPVAKQAADKIWTATLRDRVFRHLSARNCSLNVSDIEGLGVRTESLAMRDHPIHAPRQESVEDYIAYLKEPCGQSDERKIGVHVTRDARIAYPFGVLDSREGIVMDAYANHSVLKNPKYALAQMGLRAQPVASRHKAGFVLYTAWDHNFFQWTINALPRLAFLDAVPRDVPIVVYDGAPDFVRQGLDIFGSDREILRLGKGVHAFETLYVPSNVSGPDFTSDAAIAFLQGQWRDTVRQNGSRTQRDRQRLYISRKDALTRRVANEDAVERHLATRGFRSVTMSDHSTADQLELFANADFVVGPHGASFANLVFCEPRTRALEIFRKGHQSRSFYSIAGKRELVYGFMLAEPDARGDLVVDTDILDLVITEMLAEEPLVKYAT